MGENVKLITVNCTAWASLKDDLEFNQVFRQAHVVLAQEVKLEKKDFAGLCGSPLPIRRQDGQIRGGRYPVDAIFAQGVDPRSHHCGAVLGGRF